MPVTVLVAWLTIAGMFTWQDSRENLVPPIWDPETYVEKADGLWKSLLAGDGQNWLNVPPTVRPPGTVVLTAPLGPLRDFRDFFFRSVFVPVAIMIFAVFLAGFAITDRSWESALVALVAGSMPMFWQFDWGLVDTFLAGLSALAMSGLLVAALRFRYVWLILGLPALALIPVVKPSGFLLSAIISVSWLILALRFFANHPKGFARGMIGVFVTGLILTVLVGVVAYASLTSEYFSKSNINFGKEALAALRGDWVSALPPIDNAAAIITGVIGLPVLATVACLGFGFLFSRRRNPIDKIYPEVKWAAWVGVAVFCAGLAVCYQTTLLRQLRYWYPFLAVAVVLMVPMFVTWGNSVGRKICLFASITPIALLVFLGFPNTQGIALKIGGYRLPTEQGENEVREAYRFVDGFMAEHEKSPQLFTTTDTMEAMAYEAGFKWRLKSKAQLPLITRPFDWRRGGLVRIHEIYNADVMVIRRYGHSLDATQRSPYQEELAAWGAWLEKTPIQGWTKVMFETPNAISLAVLDREALAREMRSYIADRPWRPEFIAANQPVEFSAAEMKERVPMEGFITTPILFGDAVLLHSLRINRLGETSKVELDAYGEKINKETHRNYELFIHQLDENGNIIGNLHTPFAASRLTDRPISRTTEILELSPEAKKLAVGVYDPSIGELPTDWPPATDLSGQRALFDVSTLPKTTNTAPDYKTTPKQ